MDLKQIEKLMAAMERMKITKVALKRDEFEIEIERAGTSESAVSYNYPPMPSYPPPEFPKPSSSQMSETKSANEEQEARSGVFVSSPMVGTFYTSPSPEDPAFVKVGDSIEEGDVVCIIEAMKVMNEVKAGVKGEIVEILVKNGEPVEFGTHIFRVKPT